MPKFNLSIRRVFFLHFEWVALACGLLLMAFINPAGSELSICPIDRLGFSFCPGEGLGRSVAYFFRLDLQASFAMHPAGIPAVAILSARIISLLKRNYQLNKVNNDAGI